MRLTHEAIRAGLREVSALANTENEIDLNKLKQTYMDVKRTIELHAKQENDVFYHALEEKSEGVSQAFVDEHEDEAEFFGQIDQAFEKAFEDSINNGALVKLLNEWTDDHEHHLVHEESILMKILPKVFTYVESVQVVKAIIGHDLNEFENFQLSWVYNRLKEPQKEVYMGMLKGCSPENKYDDFLKKVA
jgi:hypothetical protein